MNSEQYTGPFQTEGKLEVRAVAFDRARGKSSPECRESFDIPRRDWKLIGIKDEKAGAVLDGDPATAWHQEKGKKMPVDLIIDLGKEQNLCGFRYFPDQTLWGPGIITDYEFYVSNDNTEWKMADHGEFSNIINNPVWQVRKFAPEKARFIKFRALKIGEENQNTGYAEVDIITN